MSQTALITGASNGIGYDLAKIFAKDGHNLVLVARNQKALESLAGELRAEHSIQVTVIPKDLGVASAPDEIYSECRRESIHIDMLVNNAGFGTYGFVSETDLPLLLEMLQVNGTALTHLTKLFLQGMLDRKSGRILNLASTAAFQPGPLMAVYYATKAYVLSFSEALANELNGTGVTVTVLCPGPTRTGFQRRAYMEDSGLGSGKTLRMQDSEKVARIGYESMMKGKTVVIPGFMNRVLAVAAQIGPRKMATSIARKLQEKK